MSGIHIVEEEKTSGMVCRDPTSTLLWKVQGKGNTVYIFGSIHVGKPSFYPLSPEIEMAFSSSDHFVVEVNPWSQAFMDAVNTMRGRGDIGGGDITL